MALRAICAISMRADVVISPMTSTMPVVAAVSQATRPMGSCSSTASSTLSETRSHSLSGWPCVTDSEVKIFLLFISDSFPGIKKRPARGAERYTVLSLIFRFLRRIWHLAFCRLPGFTGPFPPPLLIRLFSCTSIIQNPSKKSREKFFFRQISPFTPRQTRPYSMQNRMFTFTG